MKKIPVLAAIIFLFLALPAFAEVCSTTPPAEEQQEETGIPLEFKNSSGSVIYAIFISETGRNIWSENLLKDKALNDGENASLDIRRKNILGLTDIKIIYSSGKEKIWKKLPILEIFEITDKKDGEPVYERIKLGA
ncbi:MAG: hypothetical protein PHD08_01945 [Synergistaceae bacterium]|nr:hypothetical protein [Synergistaceae bacterium]MDD3318784.1 hypothetical protein [Synergistaceae bacterium]MDD3963454.1 hypothetical protein [Synergistaceae bacterium]MDD4704564.1 hypothetical protein [Synergistaceae bacterium]MDD5421521.1 hypothetical protein [Synergistaceae bacterium]